ncbi:MAG: hypothetical protein IPJ58_15895 [Ardenticatenia bacterium]|nr:hypothetical protein [Ardenticatenia bacterium]
MADRPLTIALLGPLRIERDGTAVRELTSAQSRALLTCLILADAPVERGRLCGLFWPDVPEVRARLSLRVALTRLRAALPGRIHADRHTAAFVAQTDDDVDTRAVRPVLEALAASAGPPPDGDAIQAAMDRLRGPLAAGLDGAATDDFRAWLTVRRSDWAALVTAALARMAKANTALGCGVPQAPLEADKAVANAPVRLAGEPDPSTPSPALSDLSAGGGWMVEALRRNPVAEPLSRRLMLDLARQGDHAAALAEHARLAAALGTQLGLHPDGATEALRDRIVTAHARGRRHNLLEAPADVASFDVDTGTTGAMVRLAAWLVESDRRLISLIGATGPVRSRLARDAALLAVNSLLDGVLWVPRWEGAADKPIALRLASALGQLDGAVPPVERIGDCLASFERLLVIDGIDEEPGAVEVLARWLEAAPMSRWLVLSAAPLGFFFEHRFPLAD